LAWEEKDVFRGDDFHLKHTGFIIMFSEMAGQEFMRKQVERVCEIFSPYSFEIEN
jgi:hypothetical protein